MAEIISQNVYSDEGGVLIRQFALDYGSRRPLAHRSVAAIEVTATSRQVNDIVNAVVGLPVLRTVPCKYGQTVITYGTGEGNLIALLDGERTKALESIRRLFTVTLVGDPDLVEGAHKKLEEVYPQHPATKAAWYFRNAKGEATSMTVQLDHRDPPLDEFYPWLDGGIEGFSKNFLADDANILLLIGEPGTGKTTFIRDFIQRNKLNSAITHDSQLMEMDEFFISFMTGEHQLLVLEDADTLLSARKHGNHVMSKLLNTSDGLIRTNKKVILTANITQLERVDSALIRPGRCFASLNFRELTHAEATLAARAAGVAEPEGPTTLANLFKKQPPHSSKPQGIGFHTNKVAA